MLKDERSIRLAVVQPQAFAGTEAPRMLADALDYVTDAARRGVDLLVFPETYPGPVSQQIRYEVVEPLQDAAARHGVALVAGTTEPVGGESDSGQENGNGYYISAVVIDADGSEVGRYRRTHPHSAVYAGLYGGGPFWDFEYVAAEELPVFAMRWGKLGISICSEVFVPEVARCLALQGAELCIFPAGCMLEDLGVAANWQTIVRARAIENLMYTATTGNLFGAQLRTAHVGSDVPGIDPGTGLNRGHAMIASPEYVLGSMRGPGILSADVNLDYIRRLRTEPEPPDVIPPVYASPTGLACLRRPELTGGVTVPNVYVG